MTSHKQNLENLLELLNLTHYYPEKLTRDELYQLTYDNVKQEKKEDVPLVWQFIQDITRYNHNARSVEDKYAPTHDFNGIKCPIHPLDIIACVYLCCEPTARQDFVLHMWTCRLAVPFILKPNQTEHVNVYIWPLRSLVGQVFENYEFFDRPLIHEEMGCIGFIRVGENDTWSKSYLLNCLLWGPNKTHSTFIHRDSEGSVSTRSFVVEGLVEIGWYLPSGEQDDRFPCPKILLNLRGDSANHTDQTKLIGQFSSVTIVLSNVKDLRSAVPIVKSLIEHKSRVIILLSDRSVGSDRHNETVEEFFSEISTEEVALLELGQKRLPEILKIIHGRIEKMEKNGEDKIVLSDLVKNISSMQAFVDETSSVYKEVFELAKDITTSFQDMNGQLIFPLQETWKEWAQTSRDFKRYHQLDDNKRKALQASREELETRMHKLRSDQYGHILKHGIAKPVELFIEAMTIFDSCTNHSHVKRRIFLRHIKIELDNMSMEILAPINKEYQELINTASNVRANEKAEINMKISDLDLKKSCLSFSLEKILRELGQIYEACHTRQQENLPMNVEKISYLAQYQKLPKHLCVCLMDGYPFELLDGEARSVPPLWTKAVLSELNSILKEGNGTGKECTMHVLSVLGIQSSGKSTLINVMFGLQFAVSAGRCTRGAFMQLVKVHESLSHCLGEGVDYIAVIDTEGLRSPALSSVQSIQHDNELSTLVIGLAHTTVINLMGENATYLRENLPIVVQAFLRMYLVHLHPRCTIVHQNVDKRNREKLLEQGIYLETVLNKLTRKACENEKVPQKPFKEIIAFDVIEQVKYIPSLFEGVLPMAPISPSYSMEINATLKLLIELVPKDFVKGVPYRYSVSSFCDHLFHLWEAIQKDDFVYEYRSTTEVALRLVIDRNYHQTLLALIEGVESIVSKKLKEIELSKLSPDRAMSELETSLKQQMETHRKNFEHFIESRQKTTTYSLEAWRANYVTNLESKFYDLSQESKSQLQDCHHTIKKRPILTEKEVKNLFEFSEIKATNSPLSSNYDFKSDAIRALENVDISSQYLLKTESIDENASISNFKISNESHINNPFGNFTTEEILGLRENMKAVIATVKEEYSEEISNIKDEQMQYYSSRIPKQILLRVEKNLDARLQTDDSTIGISHQFKIDLLSCVAMTCFRDMEKKYKIHIDKNDKDMQMYLRSSILSKCITEYTLSDAIFEVIEQSLKLNFSEKVLSFISDAFHKSVYNASTGSKKQVIGSCITFFIKNSHDDIMLEYIKYPKHALKHYLRILIESYIFEDFVECDFEFYIRRAILQVWEVFQTTGRKGSNISQKYILEAVLHNTDLPVAIKEITLTILKSVFKKDETVNFNMLRENMLHSVEDHINKMKSELIPMVHKNKEEYASDLADKLTEKLIGCLHRCQMCKEICLLSEGHMDSHIFVHRLHKEENDYIRGLGDISSVWKWISCNKREILRRENLEMVEEVPDEWESITEQQVITAIKDSLLRF
ncbi:interferon-induced very large GTPase 1-like [Mercenaria mercenaria]|uniref:interferon-induced very large GTPase 1-like n=1 Tax=Mercenaria mercenaria TaxID=6596 RepID=UPI00234F48F2|nr:interferon-induced very large GTPase 1-like [Mercenaria mercenaria]